MRTAFTHGGRVALIGAALACMTLVLPGQPAVLAAVAGLWLLFVAPTVLWFGLATRVVCTRDGAAFLAVGLTVFGDMVVGLLVNTLLPHFGVMRPLDRIPLAVGFTIAALLISVLTPAPLPVGESESPFRSRAGEGDVARRGAGMMPLAALGVLAIVLAVAGAIRLNNNLGGGVSLTALVVVAVLMLLMMLRHQTLSAAALELGIYLVSAAVLLLVSLRGWYITGHDIQSEYKVFTVALDAGRWMSDSAQSAYNACISITILPVSVVRLTGISGLYVFKVVLPLLFALAPVLVYRSVRNVGSQLIALLSAVYFVLFPTFYTDMTYLGRQEVAFVLLGCVLVVITDSARPRARPLTVRRAVVLALMAGIVLSHYSTTYVMVGTFLLACAGDQLWRLIERRCRRRATGGGDGDGVGETSGRALARGFITWWMVAVGAGLAAVWAGPLTHSGDQVRTTVSGTLFDILHPEKNQSASSDTSYSFIGRTVLTPAEALAQYRAQTLTQTAAQRAAGQLLPLSVVDRYPTVVVGQQNQPLTAVGRAVQSVGVNVSAANNAVRQIAARGLQVLLLIGLIITIWVRKRRVLPLNRDLLTLAIGSVIVLGILTVLPELSVDYGVLRAFQQALFFCAPFIAAASVWLLRWTWRKGVPMSCALALAFFLDLTGVVPTIFGGYPAQLQLANAGEYYDIYYTHAEEVSAAEWVQGQIDLQQESSSYALQMDGFAFSRLQSLIDASTVQDIYPTLIGRYTYVLLGTSTVTTGRVTVDYDGVLVTYQYPVNLLVNTKNVLYSNGGAVVFR